MANKSEALNQSEARRILQDWKLNSGEKVQDIAQKLGIEHNTVSAWFAINSKKPEPMPVSRAMALKKHYSSFPLQEYLKALIEFHEEFEPSAEKLSGIYAFIEAYGEIIGYGYWADDLKEYFGIITEVENLFSTSLPTTLTDEQKDILRKALQEIMLKEREYEDSAIVTLG